MAWMLAYIDLDIRRPRLPYALFHPRPHCNMIITDRNHNRFILEISDSHRNYEEFYSEGHYPRDTTTFAERQVSLPYHDNPRLTFSAESMLGIRYHYKVVVAANAKDVHSYVISSGDQDSAPSTLNGSLVDHFKNLQVYKLGSTTPSARFRRGDRPTIGVITVKVYRLSFTRVRPVVSHEKMSHMLFNQQVSDSRSLEKQLGLKYDIKVDLLDEYESPYVTFRYFCLLQAR
ncbi:hypothetical protein QCA50_019672 [Cerrena zonata]|uniref:Uncharacterized protein n=1 Tax=Cerrena zonata TaxID=2478898 RepID=A0AAW0FDS4_9APHY